MKNLKKKQIVFGILIVIFSLSILPNISDKLRNTLIHGNSEIEIKSGDLPDIIVTPEAKWHNNTMNTGYYSGSYGFENDLPGTMGADIDFVDNFYRSTSITYLWARVDTEVLGHKKVLSLIDSQSYSYLYVEHEGFNEVSGTMEWFWLLNSDSSDVGSYFRLMNDNDLAFEIRLRSGSFAYTGSTSGTLSAFDKTKWYHNQLWFNCSGPGNGRFTWIINYENGTELDRIENVEFINNLDTLNKIHIESTSTYHAAGHRAHFDAFGFSWEGYELGDNLNPGLLLSFQELTGADWIGYSLDGAENVTIRGNTTIPMPEPSIKPHTIQLSWQDLEDTFQSKVREFYVSPNPIGVIITPEERLYNKPMEGYYPGTFGFENDEDGLMPEGWYYWVSYNPLPMIESSIGSHNKVVRLQDQTSGGQTSLRRSFDENQSQGTIEFWIYTTDTTQRTRFYSQNASGDFSFHIRLESSTWHYYNGSDAIEIVGMPTPQDNEWIHVRIDFECDKGGYLGLGEDEFYLTINGTRSEKIPFEDDLEDINMFGFCSGVTATNFDFYVDAVGFSWDPNYEIGDNMKEGLLLSFIILDDIDWIRYSLDENSYILISGNTTIPMPDNGAHSIQLFWSNPNGFYSTDISYFQVDTEIVYLEINILEQNYTSEEFLLDIQIKNQVGAYIDFATIQVWWDGLERIDAVENNGNGIYTISLSPITVNPGDSPILLELIVNADGYPEKDFKTNIAVDPILIDKEPDQSTNQPTGDNGLIISIVIGIIAIGSGAVIIVTVGFTRKKLSKHPKI